MTANTTPTPVYVGSKGQYDIFLGDRLVGNVAGSGKAWTATFTAGQHTPTTYTGTSRAAAVDNMLANVSLAPAAPAIPNGTYTPAAPGATTWREARPLYVGNDAVTAHVDSGPQGQTLAVFVGARMVYQGPVPAEITAGHMVNPWVAAFAAQYAAGTAPAGPCVRCNAAPPRAVNTLLCAPCETAVAAPQGHAAPPVAPPAPRTPRRPPVVVVVLLVALLVSLRAVGWGARLVVLPYAALGWVALRGARTVAPWVATAYAKRAV